MPPRRGPKADVKAPIARPFSVATFRTLAKQLQDGTIPLDRVTLSDDRVTGLRCLIRNTGGATYHIAYTLSDGTRPYLLLGDIEELSLENARKLAQTVHDLAAKGIDPQDGLHKRLIRELLRDGARWKP